MYAQQASTGGNHRVGVFSLHDAAIIVYRRKARFVSPQYGLALKPLCDVVAYVSIVPIGRSSRGVRNIAPILEGSVQGPRLSGKLPPVGADFAVIRPDNCLELDVRAVVQTEDGANIYVYYHGVVDMTEEQVARFTEGEIPDGARLYTTPRFATAHDNYRWLTRLQAVGRGSVVSEGERLKVTYSWYTLEPA